MTSRPSANDHQQNWTIVLAGLGVFMTALDNLVVATALPVLRTSLHAGLSGLEWTVNAYLLAFACLILTGTALGDRFGRRRMYATGLTLFPDAVLRAAPPREARHRLYVPLGADQDEAARMRRLGYATIAALAPEGDAAAEAQRLLCSHILRNGSAVPLSTGT